MATCADKGITTTRWAGTAFQMAQEAIPSAKAEWPRMIDSGQSVAIRRRTASWDEADVWAANFKGWSHDNTLRGRTKVLRGHGRV